MAAEVVDKYNTEWNLMEKVVKVLGVYYEATLRFSSSSACISEAIPTVTSLLFTRTLSDAEDHGVKDFKRNLKKSLLERLGSKEDQERYSVATLLDPRYCVL